MEQDLRVEQEPQGRQVEQDRQEPQGQLAQRVFPSFTLMAKEICSRVIQVRQVLQARQAQPVQQVIQARQAQPVRLVLQAHKVKQAQPVRQVRQV